jgi:hypothetical protein
MEAKSPNLLWIVSYYDKLLQRYARRLVKDAEVAAAIVKDVLERQYDINGLVPAKHLRQVLKTDVLNRCYYWKQSRIFDKPTTQSTGFTYWNPDTNNPLIN